MFVGLAYSLNFSVFRSKVTSRKLTTFLFASMVVLRLLFLNTLQICFLILSVSFGVYVVEASPSSRSHLEANFNVGYFL